jgi:hypothetical protein
MKQLQKTSWSDDQWYDFLDDLKSGPGKYIPVIGSELIVVRDGNKTVNLLQLLSERVAEKLRVRKDDLSDSPSISDIVRAYLTRRQSFNLDAPYTAIVEVLSEEDWPIPDPVRKLASIRHFSFFLNATFLPYITRALKMERNYAVIEKSNIPGKVMEDFEYDDNKTDLCVFNLFGSTDLSTSGHSISFSVTDDDYLEGMHRLISNPPKNLSNHLLEQKRQLLICGCSFSNWLARFFFYSLARTAPLATEHGLRMRLVAENMTSRDESLLAFWDRLKVPVYDGNSAVAFVDELYERWHAMFGNSEDTVESNLQEYLVEVNPFTNGQIFISYDRHDADAVKIIAKNLKDTGLNVWVDYDNLGCGDLYRARIRSNIQFCSIFIPVISSNAIKNIEKDGFMYVEEWLYSKEHAELRRDGGMGQLDFIFPICFDSSVDLYDNRLPEFIRERHIEFFDNTFSEAWLKKLISARKQFARNLRGGAR